MYTQSTISNANPNAILAASLESLFLGAGWTSEAKVNYSGADWFQVFKSSGTGANANKAGYDWYVGMRWRATGSETQFQIFSGESYDVANQRLNAPATLANYASTGSSSAQGAMADGKSWGAVSLNTPALTNNYNVFQTPSPGTNSAAGLSVLLPSSPFAVWLQVSRDVVSLALLIGSTPYAFVRGTIDYEAGLGTGPLSALSPSQNAVLILDRAIDGSSLNSAFSAAASSTVARPSGWDAHRPRVTTIPGRGPNLPTLEASINAYAVRPTVELATIQKIGTPGIDVNVGQPIRLGHAFEGYFVAGGSIGDTVEIGSEVYVIMGTSTAFSNYAARTD